MSVFYLDQYELAVLGALEDQRERNITDLERKTELPVWTLRSAVGSLRRRRLIHRSTIPGRHYITETGLAQLAHSRQLRIVR